MYTAILVPDTQVLSVKQLAQLPDGQLEAMKVYADKLSDEEWAALREASHHKATSRLLNPITFHPMHRQRRGATRYFAMYPHCASGLTEPETKFHLKLKALVRDTAISMGFKASCEHAWRDGHGKAIAVADVYIERPDQRPLVVEIQHSKQTDEEYDRRTRRYDELGVDCIWLESTRKPERLHCGYVYDNGTIATSRDRKIADSLWQGFLPVGVSLRVPLDDDGDNVILPSFGCFEEQTMRTSLFMRAILAGVVPLVYANEFQIKKAPSATVYGCLCSICGKTITQWGLTNRAVGDAVPLAGTIYKIYDSVSDTGSCPQCGGDLSPRYEVASVRALEPSRHHIPFLLLPDTSKDFYPTPYIHSFLDVEGALIDEEDSTVVLPRSQQLVEKDRERVKHIGQKKTIEPIITPEPKSVPVPPVNIPVKPLSAIPVPLQASTYVWDICDTRCPRCKTLILFPREHDSGQVPFGGNAWSFMFSYYLSMRLHSTQFCTQHDDWIRCSKCRLHLSREYIQSRTPIIRIFGTSDYEQTNILSGYCGMEINHAHPFWRTVAQFADMRLARCPHCAKYFTHVNMEHTKFKQVESMQGGHSTISGFMSELAGTDPNHVPFAWFQKNRLTACPNCSKPILHPNELEGRPYWGIAYKTQ